MKQTQLGERDKLLDPIEEGGRRKEEGIRPSQLGAEVRGTQRPFMSPLPPH